ncbi:MAG: hypothetical protein WDM76_18260 [Limisphaerales bacterium]
MGCSFGNFDRAGGQPDFLQHNLSAATRTYSSLSIAAYGANSIDGTRKALIYFDNLTYSIGAVARGAGGQRPTVGVTIQLPLNGQVFAQDTPVQLSAQALTADQPITKVEFYEQPIGSGDWVKIGETINPAQPMFYSLHPGMVLALEITKWKRAQSRLIRWLPLPRRSTFILFRLLRLLQ